MEYSCASVLESVTNILEEVGDPGREVICRTQRVSPNKNSRSHQLTSDACTHKITLFARAEKKAKTSKLVHGHSRNCSPLSLHPFPGLEP